ncbi:MAG: YybH family protein [Syntrophomonadaceae bacterium]
METVEMVIRSENRKFMDSFMHQDPKKVAELYTCKAILMPPNNDEIYGSEQIRTFWQGVMNLGIKEVNLETDDIILKDNIAVETGKYTLKTSNNGDAGTVADKGKYLVVWKHEDGAWKLHLDIWNSSVSD